MVVCNGSHSYVHVVQPMTTSKCGQVVKVVSLLSHQGVLSHSSCGQDKPSGGVTDPLTKGVKECMNLGIMK